VQLQLVARLAALMALAQVADADQCWALVW
jgi:hypothetical protein